MVVAFRSETEAANETETFRRTRRALIDCDFHNELDSIKDLYPYSQRWRSTSMPTGPAARRRLLPALHGSPR